MSAAHLARETRRALLRPLEVMSEIVNRRHRMPELSVLVRSIDKDTRRTRATRKAQSAPHDAAPSNCAGGEAAPGAASGGGDGDDDGGGDGDSDGPRRRSHPHSSSTSSRAARRNASPPTPAERAHRAALLTLAFLAVLAFAMAFVFALAGYPWLAGEAIGALGGLPVLARALLRPK